MGLDPEMRRMTVGVPSAVHRRRATFEQLQHRGRDRRRGHSIRLALPLIGQHASAGHVQVYETVGIESADTDKSPDGSVNSKADQLHASLFQPACVQLVA
jgi:hypothetical protein